MRQKLYKASELAEILNVNVQTVYRAKDKGLLKFYQIGRSLRFEMPDANVIKQVKGT